VQDAVSESDMPARHATTRRPDAPDPLAASAPSVIVEGFPVKNRSLVHVALAALGALVLLAGLALVVLFYSVHQPLYAIVMLAILGAGVWIYVTPRLYAWRYVLPGALAALVFIVLPMAYTLGISFTNYSSDNLLSFQRATEVLLGKSVTSGASMDVRVFEDKGRDRFVFTGEDGASFGSDAVKLGGPVRLTLHALDAAPAADAEPLSLKQLIALQPALRQVVAVLPDARELRVSSLRRFAVSRPQYVRNPDGSLTDTVDDVRLTPDRATGFWTRADGQRVEPGFRTGVGFQNYERMFTDGRFLQPFLRVFGWTVTFAGLNTLFTFGIGVVLAVVLNWDALRYRNFYRMMLFLPYAVPAFISIPVFRGLFNENLGEINLILDGLFGIRPNWFSDNTLARAMVLAVNTWLGYPYMMILAMGLIKAIPGELYEASALAGVGPLTNFFRITLPLIARPIAPLLIASFATNFNNLTLIELLTGGAPDYLDTTVPVGATDLLASYTYRIAFQDSGQNYALACAISSIVFLIVATLAVVNLKLFKVGKADA
jgi:maltose/maltodextrin transport system permease protein